MNNNFVNADIQKREDRIGKYFRKYLNKFVFVELSPEFIASSKAGHLMAGVSVPLRQEEIQNFSGGEGISMSVIAENMTWVMGADPHFQYTKDYVAILRELYGENIEENILRVGSGAADKGELDNACIHFRAALCMKPDYLHAMYSYARVCRAMYLNNTNEEYVGRFKAEAMDWFELLTEIHPDFPHGYYYLGYAYVNIGLYTKAQIVWKKFMKVTRVAEEKKEIRERLEQIAEAVKIEAGYNDILAGRYEDGIIALEPFKDSGYRNWWPLYYYLGIAYEMTGRREEAVKALKKVLQINGSHIETMKELLAIYESEGDEVNIKKYSMKIQMVQMGMEEEQAQQVEAIAREDKKLQEEEPEKAEPEHIIVME